MAMVFQSYALYPHMSVRENLRFGLVCQKLPKPEIEARIARAADILQIAPAPRSQAGAALRRPEPARRHRPGDRQGAEGVSLRRAAVQSRRRAARPDAERDRQPPSPAQIDHRLCDPRPGRGDDHGRPDRGPARRHHRTDRHPHRALCPPAQSLRRRVPRGAANEHAVRPRSPRSIPPACRWRSTTNEARARPRSPDRPRWSGNGARSASGPSILPRRMPDKSARGSMPPRCSAPIPSSTRSLESGERLTASLRGIHRIRDGSLIGYAFDRRFVHVFDQNGVRPRTAPLVARRLPGGRIAR